MLNNLIEFFHMGGYAAYIWPAYGITFGIVFCSVYKALKYKNKVLRELREDNEGTP